MKSKYKFSVIVPVYNVEDYLAETLDSVINQSIGFEDNIQLIIVNDGSRDGSAEICKKYRDMYPDNIVYIEKENGGISSARNAGIKYIEGRYTNFLDSDDKWDLNAFSAAYDYFEKHYDEIDLLSCRVKFFEARSGYHVLDYKFNAGTRIADINNPKEYYSLQTLITPVFIKSESIKDTRFDTRIKCGEDTVFCTEILLEKCKIGYMSEVCFNYRKRASKNSTVDKIRFDKFYYTEMLEYYHFGLLNYSKEKFGRVIPYIQSLLLSDLMWHFGVCSTHEVLNDEEFSVYRKKSKELLNQIDDKIIFAHPLHKSYTKRAVAVNFKYDIDYYKSLTLKENRLFFRDFSVFSMVKSGKLCVLNSLGSDNNKFRIEILIAQWLLKATKSGGRLVLKVGERFVKPKEILEYAPKTVQTIDGGEYYYTSCVFNLKLKLKAGEAVRITPCLIYGEETVPVSLNCTDSAQGINPFTTCLVQGRYSVSYEDNAIQIDAR